MKPTKTTKQVRTEFAHRGESLASWAREHDFGRSLVYEVVAGRKKCLRGDSHRIAVLLGMKRGEVVKRLKPLNKPLNKPLKQAA